MAFNTVAAVFIRALRSGGNGTPPLLRSAKMNGLSASRTLSGGNQQDREVAKSSNSCTDTDRPGSDAPTSSEAAHRPTPADKKGTKGAPGVRGERRRSFTSAAPADPKSYMWARYNDTKRLVHGKMSTPHLLPAHPPTSNSRPRPLLFSPASNIVVFTQWRHVGPWLSFLPTNYAKQMAITDAGTSRAEHGLILTLRKLQQPTLEKPGFVFMHSSSILSHPPVCMKKQTN